MIKITLLNAFFAYLAVVNFHLPVIIVNLSFGNIPLPNKMRKINCFYLKTFVEIIFAKLTGVT